MAAAHHASLTRHCSRERIARRTRQDPVAGAADPTDTTNPMSGKRQFPKLGEYYAKMLAHCPQAISAYGACIKAAIDAGALEQGCCEREFSALKKCFREVRVKR